MSFLISNAYAAVPDAAAHPGGGMSSILMLAGFVVLFYLLLWWPQSRKVKEHRKLMDGLQKDDEVMTSGGILGKIVRINEDFITLLIAVNVEITVQKGAISATLPKGTLKI